MWLLPMFYNEELKLFPAIAFYTNTGSRHGQKLTNFHADNLPMSVRVGMTLLDIFVS